jgi:hypothetical protein
MTRREWLEDLSRWAGLAVIPGVVMASGATVPSDEFGKPGFEWAVGVYKDKPQRDIIGWEWPAAGYSKSHPVVHYKNVSKADVAKLHAYYIREKRFMSVIDLPMEESA